MGMGTTIQNPMGMGMGMGMTFENGYGCGYSSTRPEPAPRPSLIGTLNAKSTTLYASFCVVKNVTIVGNK